MSRGYVLRILLLSLIGANVLFWSLSRESANEIGAKEQFLQTLADDLSQATNAAPRDSAIRTSLQTMAMIEKEAKNADLDRLLNRIDDRGDSGVRITFSSVRFDVLMNWIVQLETNTGLQPHSVTINATEEPGMVSAQIDFSTL